MRIIIIIIRLEHGESSVFFEDKVCTIRLRLFGREHHSSNATDISFFFKLYFKILLKQYLLKHYFYVCHSKFSLWKYIYRLTCLIKQNTHTHNAWTEETKSKHSYTHTHSQSKCWNSNCIFIRQRDIHKARTHTIFFCIELRCNQFTNRIVTKQKKNRFLKKAHLEKLYFFYKSKFKRKNLLSQHV